MANYWSFSISPCNEYSGLISLEWLVWSCCCPRDSQESSPASQFTVLWHSAFFIVQFSHLYITTGKGIALTLWTFVGKVMSLLFNMLSSFVIAFLPRRKYLLISWLDHQSQWFWSPRKESVTVTIVSPSICHEVMGPDVMILVFECWVLSQLFHSPL